MLNTLICHNFVTIQSCVDVTQDEINAEDEHYTFGK